MSLHVCIYVFLCVYVSLKASYCLKSTLPPLCPLSSGWHLSSSQLKTERCNNGRVTKWLLFSFARRTFFKMILRGNKCTAKSSLLIIILLIQLSIELLSSNLNAVHCQSATNLSSNSPESSSSDDDFNDEAIGPEVNFTLTSKDKIGESWRWWFYIFLFSLSLSLSLSPSLSFISSLFVFRLFRFIALQGRATGRKEEEWRKINENLSWNWMNERGSSQNQVQPEWLMRCTITQNNSLWLKVYLCVYRRVQSESFLDSVCVIALLMRTQKDLKREREREEEKK